MRPINDICDAMIDLIEKMGEKKIINEDLKSLLMEYELTVKEAKEIIKSPVYSDKIRQAVEQHLKKIERVKHILCLVSN